MQIGKAEYLSKEWNIYRHCQEDQGASHHPPKGRIGGAHCLQDGPGPGSICQNKGQISKNEGGISQCPGFGLTLTTIE